jgi:hypothetical protein
VLLLDHQLSLYQRLNITILIILEYDYITTQMSYYELYQCFILAMRFLCQRFVSCFSLYMIVQYLKPTTVNINEPYSFPEPIA